MAGSNSPPNIQHLLSTKPRHSKPEKPSTTPIAPINGNNRGASLIRIICISDTHNTTPPLPPGDILIHAGDLTATGTLDEIQSQLIWLSFQPHRYKIVIAGNHDILLDEGCDAIFLARGGDSAAERKELDWGGIRYLRDEAVTLEIATSTGTSTGEGEARARQVKIYGSPHTPECGLFAFQYPVIRDVWTGRVPDDTDILVVHGPPVLYGDCDGEVGQGGNVRSRVTGISCGSFGGSGLGWLFVGISTGLMDYLLSGMMVCRTLWRECGWAGMDLGSLDL